MRSILGYILLSAVRDRLYLALFLILFAAFGLSVFLGSTAFIEQQQMAIVYVAGSSRLILGIGFILFVCLSVSRAFENKEVEFIISKSISRQKFILSYILGFFLVASLILIPLIVSLSIIDKINGLGLFYWSLSVFFELLILISFCVLASLILNSGLLAIMASLGFYLISRMMGLFVVAIDLPQSFEQAQGTALKSSLKFLSVLFPRLDLFGQTKWLVYGVNDFLVIKIIILQALIFCPLMLFMSFHDFNKKQF